MLSETNRNDEKNKPRGVFESGVGGLTVFRELIKNGHEVIALDIAQRDIGITSGFEFKKIDVTDPETLEGVCDGADVVITTVGLTKGSATVSNYDIDFQGNLNLLNEAKKAGIKNFVYISVVKLKLVKKERKSEAADTHSVRDHTVDKIILYFLPVHIELDVKTLNMSDSFQTSEHVCCMPDCTLEFSGRRV